MLDPYLILGIDQDANQKAIKKAFRHLAKIHHPDTSKLDDSEEKFQEILHAYLILSDPEKKAIYDNGFEFPEVELPARDKYPPPHAFKKRYPFYDRPMGNVPFSGQENFEYDRYSRSAKVIGIVTFLFALTFLVDYLFYSESLDLTISRVQSKALITKNADDLRDLIITAGNQQFEKRQVVKNELKVGEIISIRKSLLYGYINFKRADTNSFQSAKGVSGILKFGALIIYIASLTAIFSKKSPELKFNAALIAGFCGLIILAFVLLT